jgi:hypothetical protein
MAWTYVGDGSDDAGGKTAPPAAAQNSAPAISLSVDQPTDPHARIVKAWMDKAGVPQHVAEGIADRAMIESSGRPTAVGDGGTSGGFYQEHDSRWTGLKLFAERSGKPWTDPDIQNEYAIWEATKGDPIAAKHWNEIKNAPDRATAKTLFTKYFERPAASSWSPVAAGKWNVDPAAIASAQARGDGSVWWMTPQEYRASIEETPSSSKRRSLLKSLMGGDAIADLPELETASQDGQTRIVGHDGSSRARIAEEELGPNGLIPVFIKGVTGDKAPSWITDAHGNERPFNFMPVAKVAPAAKPSTLTGMPGLATPGGATGDTALAHVLAAAGSGFSEGFGDRPLGLPKDVVPDGPLRPIYQSMAVPADAAIRAGQGALFGAARGGGQALGEFTGAASQPGFDPGIGAIREVIQPGMAFMAGAGAMPQVPRVPELAERAPMPAAAPTTMSPQVSQFLNAVRQTGDIENKARSLINQSAVRDMAGGGAVPAEMAKQLAAGRGEGMALVDVAGENVRGLLGNVAREPGPGREVVKQWAVNRLGDVDRDSPLATNIEKGVEANLATGSARTEARALAEQRAASKPLWDEAMSGGNIIPVEEQVAIDYGKAARAEQAASAAHGKAQEEVVLAERAARDQSVTLPRQPTRLSTFLVRSGGLQNQGGELSYILGDNKTRPGLINQAGKTLDDAALDAWEAGYLPGTERPSTNDLLDAIAQDINKEPVYSELDADAAQAYREAAARNAEADRAKQQRPGPAGQPKMTAKTLQFARDKAAMAEATMRRAQEEKADLAGVIQQARLDGTADAPGAVWSPYVGRLLKNPIIQQGVRRGYQIERNIADGENRPFKPKEYAVVGEDAAGDPIVGAVPNMKLMAVAKEGLDAMLESETYKDPLTGRLNKAGRAVKILRDGMLNELDRLNPSYKPARDKWAGDSALIAAVRDGKNFHKQSPEEIREWFDNASDSEKSFYRIGASDTMRDDLQRRVFAGDPSKAIINSPRARNQLLPMFRSAEDATKFLDQVKRARTMFNTPVEVLGNSKTAARGAEDLARRQGLDNVADLIHGVASAAAGHHGNALYRFSRGMSRLLNPPADPRVNAAVARLLTDSNLRINPSPGQQLLRSVPLPKVQNAMARGLLNYSRRFAAPGGLP